MTEVMHTEVGPDTHCVRTLQGLTFFALAVLEIQCDVLVRLL